MSQIKKTKIVATIGPKTESIEQLERLLKAGVNVVRLNFSHGDFAEHQAKIDNVKIASQKTGIPFAIMQDLAGPEVRTGKFEGDIVKLLKGKDVVVTTKNVLGTEKLVPVDYKKLPEEVKVGGLILIDDGKVQLRIKKISVAKGEILCTVIAGGKVKAKRGVNLPGASLSLKSLTAKDKKDLAFAKQNNVDFVAFSFVRTASDVRELRKILDGMGLKQTGIIPKIETGQAVENIDEIIKLSDAVMVARGDLAPEMTLEDVPLVQKMIIEKCNAVGRPVITATQMIESMMENPVPTRAEVSDIANAVLDGTDAIMLSGETALGEYPIEVVEVMSRVVEKIENSDRHEEMVSNKKTYDEEHPQMHNAVTDGAVDAAESLGVKLIIALTTTGRTARLISRYKPKQRIIAFTPDQKTFNKLVLNYGVTPVLTKTFSKHSEVLDQVRKYCLESKLAKKGDRVVVVSSMPLGKASDTNMMLVHEI